MPNRSSQYTLQGLLMCCAPLTMLSAHSVNPLLPGAWNIAASGLAALMLTAALALLLKYPLVGRILTVAGILLNSFVLFFDMCSSPLLSLFWLLLAAGGIYYSFTAHISSVPAVNSSQQFCRLQGACAGLFALTVFSPLFAAEYYLFSHAVFAALMIMLLVFAGYCRLRRYFGHKKLVIALLTAATAGLFAAVWKLDMVLIAFFISLPMLIWIIRKKHSDWQYLTLVLQHPARCLGVTFLLLSIAGTLLLSTEAASPGGSLAAGDAAFTAVSAACVTGLTTINIASELTGVGRFFLLLIIQLGGLGIMSLGALVLHALGRLSLNGEQLISELTDNQEQDIFQHLSLIVRFTFTVEACCALLLSWGFYNIHHDWLKAFELGIFTSVSAYCNAGFFPGAENLVPYSGEKLLLTVIACEIIIGGIAPAASCMFLRLQTLRRLPFVVEMVFISTGILLLSGTFLLLLFEWDGIFSNLPPADKLVNSFFLSASLRTAGFNTVALTGVGVPGFLVMLMLMFIGGSPGGTAGGIKTTTAAVLALTFRAALRRSETVTVNQHRIAAVSIIQAVAVLIAALMVLFAVVIMLSVTQIMPLKVIFFEAVSALATVGLSLDGTGQLDAVGQVIIMAAMLAGRLGPLTLFLLLSERRGEKQPGYPQSRIPLG